MASNPKSALGILTMAAPIVLLGSLCTVCTFFYQITGVPLIHHVGNKEYQICVNTRYVQILYGVCNRGKVTGIDPTISCMQWTDLNKWEAMDKKNAIGAAANKAYFTKTDTLDEVQSKWRTIRNMCLMTIPMGFVNLLLCLIAADVDVELPEWFPLDVTFDQLTILYSCVSVTLIMLAFLITICFGYFSDVLNKLSWTDSNCHYKSSPAYGYFIMVLGGFFALISLYVSCVSYYNIYILKKTDDGTAATFSPLAPNSIAPEPLHPHEEGDEDDDDEDTNNMHGTRGARAITPQSASDTAPLARPRTPQQVAPAPPENYSSVVLG